MLRLGLWPLSDMPTVGEEESELGQQYPPQTEIETHFRDKGEMGPGPEGWGGVSLGRTSFLRVLSGLCYSEHQLPDSAN